MNIEKLRKLKKAVADENWSMVEIHVADLVCEAESNPHETIVKCPLPDVFAGDLNTRRIEKYQEIKKQYMVSEGTVMDLFNAGIDWYKQIIEESGT